MTTAKWSRLVRFVSRLGETLLGEPLAGDAHRARVLSSLDPFDPQAQLTSRVEGIARLLSPVVPTALVCIGLNYAQHARETDKPLPSFPVVFSKSLGAAQDPFGPIVLPAVAQDPPEVDYEAELAFVIGRPARDVSEADALAYVGGYLCANDVSARRWQGGRGGGQWYTGKSFDTFCPLGPQLVAPHVVGDPNALAISLTLNGATMQSSNTSDMIFGVSKLVSFLSQGTTLQTGTVVLTGTPSGVGFTRTPPVYLKDGDVVVVEIEKVWRAILLCQLTITTAGQAGEPRRGRSPWPSQGRCVLCCCCSPLKCTRNTSTQKNKTSFISVGSDVFCDGGHVHVCDAVQQGQQLLGNDLDAAPRVALDVERQHGVVQRQAQQQPAIAALGVARNTDALKVVGDEAPAGHAHGALAELLDRLGAHGLEVGGGDLEPEL